MRAVIIGSGSADNADFHKNLIHKDDFIICADGGYDRAVYIGVEPDIVIGDMDSVKTDIAAKTIKYPKRKEMTDGEIAIRYAVENGFLDIVMIGFIGTRIDHTLTNIFLLKTIHDLGAKGVIIDEHNEIYLLRDNIQINGSCGDIISIIPIMGDIFGVKTDGLDYPLFSETLYFGQSRGVSNIMTGNSCRISLKDGTALVIKSVD